MPGGRKGVGLTRQDDYDSLQVPWVAPSPNLPTMDSTRCYIGTCHLEGTNLSAGRGTTKPFEVMGAPWLRAGEVCRAMNAKKLPGVFFREMDFLPGFHKYAGQVCHGMQLHITDKKTFRSFLTGLELIQQIRSTHEEFEFHYRPNLEVYSMDILLGKDTARREDFDPKRFVEEEQAAIREFMPRLRPYYIY